MNNHKECQHCNDLQDQINELKAAFIDLNIDVRVQREYDHAREKLTAWLEATKHRLHGTERKAKEEEARDALNNLNRCYFDVPHKRGKVQMAIDVAQVSIDYYEKTYSKTTKL